MCDLYIPLKIHKFTVEIYSLFVRVFQAYERDLILYIIGYISLNKSLILNEKNIFKTLLEKAKGKRPLENIKKLLTTET